MKENDILLYLEKFAQYQLNEIIMPFWRNNTPDHERDGFFGQINNDLSVNTNAEKGQVLNARILWTFSAVYQKMKNLKDLELAQRAYSYINEYFFDPVYGGYYWALNPDGSPSQTKKQIYAQAFVIYALSEYFKVTNDQSVLQKAIELFQLIEEHSFDNKKNGYIEARSREWKEMGDIRLSAKDMNEKKSMNTHLHVLEAYANLYRVWKDPYLLKKLENLISIFINFFIDKKDNHQILFFDDDWNSRSTIISYGHDIETSWLLHEAAVISGNTALIELVSKKCLQMVDAVKPGFSSKGALYYETDRQGKHEEREIEWWAQAESIVGLLNAYLLKKDPAYLTLALNVTRFIEDFVVDKKNGEWFFRVTETGEPILKHEKAGFWKCPYHNSRACLEILHRLEILKKH